VHLGLRKLLMALLLASFAGQSALVYFDDTADKLPGLSELGVKGRRIWHDHNCGVCHQVYGFGGFLGPDLTNAAQRLPRSRYEEVLTLGTAQMPAFHFTSQQISAVEQFLIELDRTGIGVARQAPPIGSRSLLAALDAHAVQSPPPDAARRGMATFQKYCTACHVPLQATPLGFNTAPDLSSVVSRLDDAAIRTTIVQGRPAKGMMSWPMLDAAAVDDVIAFFHWLGRERNTIAARVAGLGTAQPLPWWEFR
jgi:nitric oxide reductase subunit C